MKRATERAGGSIVVSPVVVGGGGRSPRHQLAADAPRLCPAGADFVFRDGWPAKVRGASRAIPRQLEDAAICQPVFLTADGAGYASDF
ncbi:hypothetical protein EBQ93_01585 [bacterium]|nr:hypothetical protein [bacterium]